MFNFKNNGTLLDKQELTFDKTTTSLPIADINPQNKEVVLITAGMDGDEYTGIEAAYQLIPLLIKERSNKRFIVLPVINQFGFEKNVSYNPIDNTFPKLAFPGKKNDTFTQQLIHWLFTTYVKDASIWIDLHSGANNETLSPYVATINTGKKSLDEKTLTLLSATKADVKLCEKSWIPINDMLKKQNTSYFLFESGEHGKRESKYIRQHVTWAMAIVRAKGLTGRKKLSVYAKTNFQMAMCDGLWYPKFQEKIKRNMIVGTIVSETLDKAYTVTAKHNGVFLFGKTDMSCKKGDTLLSYASDPKTI